MWKPHERWRGGKSPHRYSYTINDIAKARGVTVYAVRQAQQRGRVNIRDLQSIAGYIKGGERRMKVSMMEDCDKTEMVKMKGEKSKGKKKMKGKKKKMSKMEM